MTPVEGGRGCGRCDRRVVDFRGAGDEEIARAYLEGGAPVCGAFSPEQQARWAGSLPILIPLALGATLLGGRVAAQHVPTPEPVARDSAAAPAEGVLVATGTVRDSGGRPLSGVSVSLEGSRHGVHSDLAGRYTLHIALPPNSVLHGRIVFARVGYSIVRRKAVLRPDSPVRLDAALSPSRIELVGIVVPAERPSLWERIRRVAGRIF